METKSQGRQNPEWPRADVTEHNRWIITKLLPADTDVCLIHKNQLVLVIWIQFRIPETTFDCFHILEMEIFLFLGLMWKGGC